MITIIFTFSTSASLAKAFPDVTDTNAYYYDAVLELSERNVIEGYPNGEFGPNDAITRDAAAKIIAVALDLDTSNVQNPGFHDVSKKHWAYPYIAAVASKGIVTGYSDKTFKPSNTITRVEMASMIKKAFDLTGSTTLPFHDVPNWAKGYVQALYDHEVTKGVSTTAFGSDQKVSRGQIATFVVRAEGIATQNPGEEPNTPPVGEDFEVVGIE